MYVCNGFEDAVRMLHVNLLCRVASVTPYWPRHSRTSPGRFLRAGQGTRVVGQVKRLTVYFSSLHRILPFPLGGCPFSPQPYISNLKYTGNLRSPGDHGPSRDKRKYEVGAESHPARRYFGWKVAWFLSIRLRIISS